MQLRKYRWSRHYESAEEELQQLLRSRNIEAGRWTAEEFQTFDAHSHPKDKLLWCAEGSIVISADGREFSLQAGDALELPAGTAHSAVAGIAGAVCYESPLPEENPALPA